MPDDELLIVRSSVEEARAVAASLVDAHRDQVDRTVRVLQLMALALGGELAVVTLLVQARASLDPVEAMLMSGGLLLSLLTVLFLLVAQTNLPHDAFWSWGYMPRTYVRRAVRAAGDERAWLLQMAAELDERVSHNADVIATLIRRRDRALVCGAAGLLLFLLAAAYIAGGVVLG